MNSIKFYELTNEMLLEVAKDRGLSKDDLNCYFELADLKCPSLKGVDGVNLAFAQILKHACNATMISNIVDWENNINFIKEVTCNFNPKEFVKFNNLEMTKEFKKDDIEVIELVERFRTTFKWNSEKSQDKDALAKRYAITMIEAAMYASQFESKDALLNDLKEHYKNKNVEEVVKYFMSKIKNGFSVALTCDFLKEFDIEFNDIAKPDVHILDVMKCKENKEYNKTKDHDLYECINDMRKIVDEVNTNVKNENLTVYKLDRMIWLICSDKFFLHGLANAEKKYKEKYLSKITNS